MDAAVGTIAISKDRLRTMLSNCTYWRQFDGLSLTVSQAAERIFIDTLPLGDDLLSDHNLRPYAVVHNGERPTVWRGLSGPRLYEVSGSLVVEFHRNPPTLKPDDPGDPEREYANQIGRIVSSGDSNNPGLLELSALDTNLDILEARADGPFRAAVDTVSVLGDADLFFVEIDWGTRR